jgi:hypothetical protein
MRTLRARRRDEEDERRKGRQVGCGQSSAASAIAACKHNCRSSPRLSPRPPHENRQDDGNQRVPQALCAEGDGAGTSALGARRPLRHPNAPDIRNAGGRQGAALQPEAGRRHGLCPAGGGRAASPRHPGPGGRRRCERGGVEPDSRGAARARSRRGARWCADPPPPPLCAAALSLVSATSAQALVVPSQESTGGLGKAGKGGASSSGELPGLAWHAPPLLSYASAYASTGLSADCLRPPWHALQLPA